KSRTNLRAPGAAEALRRLSSGLECGVSIFRRHRDGRLAFRQTASRGSGQYRRGGGLFIRELANNQPIMVAEGQVPPYEPASHALEEFGNGFLTIFWLSQHALDGVRSKTPARDVDRHGISPWKKFCLLNPVGAEHYRHGHDGFKGP